MLSRHLPRWTLWCLCSALVVCGVISRGEARPTYKKAFETLYAGIGKQNKTNCNVCHPAGSDDKRRRNHYGVALAEALGEKGVKDLEKVIEALKDIEDGECRSGNWKLRLEKGLAPCVCGRGDHEAGSYIARQLQRPNQQ